MLRLLGNIRIIGVFVGIILMNDKYNLPWPMYYMAFYYIGYELVVVLLPLLTLAVVLLTCPTVLVRILLVSRRMLGADSNVMPGDPFGRVRGLKRELLGRIPESTYHSNNTSSEEGEQCVICLVEFVEGDMVKQIPGCKHQFHSKCIDEWLLINHHCPLCMQDVSSRLESE